MAMQSSYTITDSMWTVCGNLTYPAVYPENSVPERDTLLLLALQSFHMLVSKPLSPFQNYKLIRLSQSTLPILFLLLTLPANSSVTMVLFLAAIICVPTFRNVSCGILS